MVHLWPQSNNFSHWLSQSNSNIDVVHSLHGAVCIWEHFNSSVHDTLQGGHGSQHLPKNSKIANTTSFSVILKFNRFQNWNMLVFKKKPCETKRFISALKNSDVVEARRGYTHLCRRLFCLLSYRLSKFLSYFASYLTYKLHILFWIRKFCFRS